MPEASSNPTGTADSAASGTATATDLDARYGRSPKAKRNNRVIVIAVAAAFVTVFTAWLVWGGLLESPAQFEAKDTGYELIDDTAVEVRWQFNVAENQDARCAVQALNSTFAIIGWKVVDVPGSDQRNRELSTTVRTTELAVSGLIYRCWLT
ncbi:DUF4307 domain-containing protein [Salinibacterium sp. SWN248]|uniref:DUF4307 domain-containing protein n=1 Tax=Salinibacterium sp. SWN248 TaxID=2792056 RepID=UPI0018CEF94A|nr:DUF4307 domain-containing protein [Salinibacterium sp. SWN248]MBH0024663.1 DUF4307 domain-containing protein [Salinibacterium sp. SWN248]